MLFRLIKGFAGLGRTPAAEITPGGVYVCLMGGLGNQLFQYAFARYLAAQSIVVSGLVTNLFGEDKYSRRVLVDALSRIPVAKLSKDAIATLKVLTGENGLEIRDALLQGAPAGMACRGYWQDAQFADAVTGELAADLKSYGAQRWPTTRDDLECVVHVRRHDYGHNGLLPLAYYQTALESCGWPRFAVVTDEPNFCEYMFSRMQGYAGVIRGDTADPWGDFFLMSRSRVQVIANSSFSWWTAWLGQATGATATVVAPVEWTLMNDMNPCPARWRRNDTRLARP